MKRIVSVIIFLLLLIPAKLKAVDEAHMILAHPGEHANTQINISWHMDASITDAKLIYTLKTDVNWDEAITVEATYERNTVFKDKVFNHYQVSLTDLIPNRQYKYKVGAHTFSDEQYFKTGANTFSFAWVSDWHTWLSNPGRTTANTNLIEKMLQTEKKIQMILSTGDEVAYGNEYDSWALSNSQPHFKNHIKASTIGNHDYLNNLPGQGETYDFFKSVHHFPKNGYDNQIGVSYYFKYGKTLFIMLNSDDVVVKNNQAGRRWASDVIKNNPSDFIVVAMHYNWFSGDSGNSYQYNHWKTFFDEHEVDLALSGHNHIYVRTHRLYEDKVNDDKGTVYMQALSSDNDRGRVITDNYNNKDLIAHRFSEGVYSVGGVIVDVDERQIKTRLVNRQGEVIDEATIKKREKPNFDKAAFISSFNYYKDGQTHYVSASPKGVNHIESITYYDKETIIGMNAFYKKDLSVFKLNTTSPNIKVVITFSDKTTHTLTLNLLSDNYQQISNLTVLKAENYILTWAYQGVSEVGYIYIDDVFYQSVDLLDKRIDLGTIDPLSVISIRPSQDSTNARYYATYTTYGDANFDGDLNELDIAYLMDVYFSKETLTASELTFLDMNEDLLIDLYDITFIHLYIKGLIEQMETKYITVTFLDMEGDILLTKTVPAGTAIIPPAYDVAGYSFILWDKDLSHISTPLTIRPVMGVD